MSLQNKVKKFIDISGMSKTTFCKRCDISLTTLDCWLNDKREISDILQQKMINTMSNCIKSLIEIANE